MAALTGQRVKDTYKDLLQVSNSNSGIDATMRAVSDGEGTASLLYLSSAGVAVNTGLNIGAATAVASGKVTQTASLTAATGDEYAFNLAYTTNKATSGDDTGLYIVQTDTSSPGSSYLIEAKRGSTKTFQLSNLGKVSLNTSLIADTGDEVGFSLAYTTNKLTSGDDTGLKITMTDTTSPGTSLLLNAIVGSTSLLSLSNAGVATLAGSIAATKTITTADADGTRHFSFTATSNTDPAASAEVNAGYFAFNKTAGSNGTYIYNALEGVYRSQYADESSTGRGVYGRFYIDPASSATLRTGIGVECSARASYAGGTAIAAESGTCFVGQRIWMAPYFSSGTVGNVNNFWGQWIYGEHTTQRNADAAIKIGDAGGGWGELINGTNTTGPGFTFGATLDSTSADETAYTLNYTTNKASGSNNDTGLQIVMTDTASPGTSLLIDAKVGATSIFRVSNVGGFGYTESRVIRNNDVSGIIGLFNSGTGLWEAVLETGYSGGGAKVDLAYDVPIGWDSTNNALAGTRDSGLARSAAGVVKVTDGSTGTGSLVASSAITAVGTAAYNGVIRTGVYKRAWTNAEVVALGAIKDAELKVATLPAKTIVRNAYVVVDTRETVLDDLTVALGRTGATYIDYIVASDAKAESLGSELVTNGAFTGNATGWTLGASGGTPDWYYDTDKVSHASDSATGTLTPTTPLVAVAGTQYKLVWTMAHTSGTGVTASFGGTAGTQRSSSATFTEYLTAASTASLTFTPTANWVGSVDTISLKEVARTVYGDAVAERGTNLTGYDLPSYTATTDVYLNFVTTDAGDDLNDALQCTGTVYLMTEILP